MKNVVKRGACKWSPKEKDLKESQRIELTKSLI